MSDFEKVLDEYKEQTKPMCEALGCIELLDDFLVDIELSRAQYHHFYQAGQQSQQAKIDELAKELSTTKQVLHNVIDMERAKKIELEKKINANKEKISYALKHNGRCNETTIRVLEGILNDQSN